MGEYSAGPGHTGPSKQYLHEIEGTSIADVPDEYAATATVEAEEDEEEKEQQEYLIEQGLRSRK